MSVTTSMPRSGRPRIRRHASLGRQSHDSQPALGTSARLGPGVSFLRREMASVGRGVHPGGREAEDGRGPMSTLNTLRGRDEECLALDRLIATVRGGESRTLVLRGEPGIGKSALLEYVVGRASGCRVLRAAGV